MPTTKKKKAPAKKVAAKKTAVKQPVSKPAVTKKTSKPLPTTSIVLGALVVLALGFAAGAGLKNDQAPIIKMIAPKAEKTDALLFVQQAVTGSFRPNADGTYNLLMVGVKPHTLVVADRPNRVVGTWTNTDFVTRWAQGANGLAADTQNAVLLSHSPADGKEYSVPVTLSNPEFNGPDGWITYTVALRNEANTSDLTISEDRHTEAFPEALRSPVLFIEGGKK